MDKLFEERYTISRKEPSLCIQSNENSLILEGDVNGDWRSRSILLADPDATTKVETLLKKFRDAQRQQMIDNTQARLDEFDADMIALNDKIANFITESQL